VSNRADSGRQRGRTPDARSGRTGESDEVARGKWPGEVGEIADAISGEACRLASAHARGARAGARREAQARQDGREEPQP
jgi:hypothetical protein